MTTDKRTELETPSLLELLVAAKNIDYEVTWKIMDRGKPFSPVSNLCNLCTKEKYFIIFEPEEATLNRRDELNNCCLHKSPVLLDKT